MSTNRWRNHMSPRITVSLLFSLYYHDRKLRQRFVIVYLFCKSLFLICHSKNFSSLYTFFTNMWTTYFSWWDNLTFTEKLLRYVTLFFKLPTECKTKQRNFFVKFLGLQVLCVHASLWYKQKWYSTTSIEQKVVFFLR